MAADHLFRDPAGTWHRVAVVDRGKRTATIEYFDNSRRYETWRHGRRYVHGARVRLIVNLHEIKEKN